ncbi:MAG: sulfatase-like hydrolase/transferase [Verrucomicrobia bacterium]|nr:sulfatase-like hydrolase/transferase [Verrucomicrobiota bacterium]
MKYSILFILQTLAIFSAQGAEPASRPNILYLFVDDMGWGSIGPNGQAARKDKGLPYVRTPNIDRLAEQGVNFTRAYACHVCSPSRSSQQSGFHQGHTFADANDPDNARKAMRAEDLLMGDALFAAGYTTGYWGKWGYGGSKDQFNPKVDNVQSLPTSHGYTHVLAELHHVRAHTFFQPSLWSAPAKTDAIGGIHLIPNSIAKYVGSDAYPDLPAYQNHHDYPAVAYCDDAYAFAALDFVRINARNYQKTGKPFFGLLATQIPHAPFNEISHLPNWDHAYEDDPAFKNLSPQAQQWAAMVTRMDAHFGHLLSALEDPNQDGDTSDSIADNTLVIFQSDNGGPRGSSHTVFDSNGGLRGSKGKIQEGGIRVPLVMRWPSVIHSKSKLKSGTQCARIVDITDLLPTFCELAGTPSPLSIDGVSIAPVLSGYGQQRNRDFIIHEASNGQSIIRGKHKLVRARVRGNRDTPIELYDLERDQTEEANIAANHPELVKELHALLLGERVSEAKGFANTYHHWIGDDGGLMSHPENWSDYTYANAGVTYLSDDGGPQLSWTALIENKGITHRTVSADIDLEFLGFEISGSSMETTQTLQIDQGIKLTGRNEIRLSNNGNLVINGGTLSSLRWVDIQPGGILQGNGRIEASLYNDGIVSTSGKTPLEVSTDYYETMDARLRVSIADDTSTGLKVTGKAILAGTLDIARSDLSAKANRPYTILTARQIEGTFRNMNQRVTDGNDQLFSIHYTDSEVSLLPVK